MSTMNNYKNHANDPERAVFLFLDGLRETGVTNMFGASPYIRKRFPDLNRYEANRLLCKWMETFEARHADAN